MKANMQLIKIIIIFIKFEPDYYLVFINLNQVGYFQYQMKDLLFKFIVKKRNYFNFY